MFGLLLRTWSAIPPQHQYQSLRQKDSGGNHSPILEGHTQNLMHSPRGSASSLQAERNFGHRTSWKPIEGRDVSSLEAEREKVYLLGEVKLMEGVWKQYKVSPGCSRVFEPGAASLPWPWRQSLERLQMGSESQIVPLAPKNLFLP